VLQIEGQNDLNLLVPLTRQPHRKEDAIFVSHSFYFIYATYSVLSEREPKSPTERSPHNYTNHQGLKSKVGA
jgi:hypothetical protein